MSVETLGLGAPGGPAPAGSRDNRDAAKVAARYGTAKTIAAETTNAAGQLRSPTRPRPKVPHSFLRWPRGVRVKVISTTATRGDTMVSSWTMLAWGRANATPRIIRVTRPTKVDASRSGWLVDRAGAVVGASGISVVVMVESWAPDALATRRLLDGPRDLVVAWSPQPSDRDADT